MQRVRVKVCGVTRLEDVEMLDGVVDYVGFIVGPRGLSPRILSPQRASELAGSLGRSKPVLVVTGMVVRESIGLARSLEVFPILQHHSVLEDGEEAKLLAKLSKEVGIAPSPVSLWGGRGLEPEPCRLSHWVENHEYILVDSRKGMPGIPGLHGLRTPLEAISRAVSCSDRTAAAGGINHENVCRVLSTGVSMIDVSSGVESRPGVKDPSLVKRFLEAIRSC